MTRWYAPTVIADWRAAGHPLGTIGKTTTAELAPRLSRGEVTVIDVRNRSEWEAGHIPGAIHIPVGHLVERLGEIPRDKPIVVQCQSGGRSAIAASWLHKLGVTEASNLAGGIVGWRQAGNEVVRDVVPAEV